MDADGVIARLEAAEILKEEGTRLLKGGDAAEGCRHYEAAVAELAHIPIGGCPSDNEQYVRRGAAACMHPSTHTRLLTPLYR